ncbi:MAG: biopolymer transporter ExbD [Candidatus Manganitrophaceae bacterium]
MLRLKSRRTVSGSGPAIDMTPMIDMVFQLLIFFLLTSIFASQPVLDLVLPEAGNTRAPDERKEIALFLQKNGSIMIDRDEVSPEALRAVLEKRMGENRDIPVLLSADRDVPFQRFVTVLDALQGLGLPNLTILTQPREDGS